MAKKKKAEEGSEESEAEGGKGGGGKMMPAAMISLALVAAGYFVGGRGGAAPATAETIVTIVEASEPEVGEIINLEPVNVNLADGHYLRIAISIGMELHEESSGDAAAAGHGTATDATATTEPTAPAADLVLSTFAGKTIEELSTLEGRVAARDHLHEGLKEFYGEEVLTVFFTEFVMQ